MACAIAALPDDVTEIAVHGARPLVAPEVIGRCIDVARTGVGAVAGEPTSIRSSELIKKTCHCNYGPFDLVVNNTPKCSRL